MLRCTLVDSAGWIAVALACLCWLDLFLAFGPLARIILGCLCLAGFVTWLSIKVAGIVRISEKDSAIHADTLIKSRRREILSAWEIGKNPSGHSSLTAYLAKKGVETAQARLTSLRQVNLNTIPRNVLKRVAICMALAMIPAFLSPGASVTLVSRFLFPYADIPPYSPCEFTISPSKPEVVYGSDLVIQVSVDGKKGNQPVRFATRKKGQVLETESYQAGPDTYIQQLEKVMQPMEFCFLLGKSRSRWHRIDVLYQPHILSSRLRIVPPAYSGNPEKTFDLGSEALKGLKGSQVVMSVTSNRPLKNGDLSIIPIRTAGHVETVPGELTGQYEITFNWEITLHAQLSVMINDILGTPAKEPLKIRQELVPDEKPEVSLSEPMGFSLATPSVKVPLYASIDDDLGIKRCDLFRSLKGYRSRALPLKITTGTDSYEFNGELDLAVLGVEPGQVIELFLEASDTNPELTGINASDIARIKIISEEEYAMMVRERTTIEAFENRFRHIATHCDALLKQLERTRSGLMNDELTPDEAGKQIKQLQKLIKESSDSIQAIADDFVAFDLEKRLSESAGNMVETFEKALEHNGWDSPDKDSQMAALSHSIRVIKGFDHTNRKLQEDAGEIASVSRVMAMAAWYRALLDRQMVLVSSLRQLASGERKTSKPRILAEQEANIRKDLEELTENLEHLAEKLPAGYESLKESSLEFVKRVRSLDVTAPMKACENACINEKPREAWNYALKAYEQMQEVLRKCNGNSFAQVCSGNITFNVPGQLSRTLSQMLQSLMKQFSRGVGWGHGTGAAGVGVAGAWEGSYLDGYSAFSFPVYGPERKNPFSSAAMGKKGDKGNPGHGVGRKANYNESFRASEKNKTGGAGFFMEEVPPRYRDAVKSFYSGDQP